MSVRHALLGLLAAGPKYGYQLRAQFERATGATWPLNVGQVYSTLGRLERDGLVVGAGSDGEGHVHYEATAAGRDELEQWLRAPVDRSTPPRDELTIKVAVALTLPAVDSLEVIARQRAATITVLQDYTKLKRAGEPRATPTEDELAWSLVLESLIFNAEAEVRWLDHCEARLRRLSGAGGTAASGITVPAHRGGADSAGAAEPSSEQGSPDSPVQITSTPGEAAHE